MVQHDFEEKVLECVDGGMAILGESTRQAIFWHIEQNDHLKHEEIPRKPRQFIRALEEMLGTMGVRMLEKNIVAEMKMKFRIPPNTESFEKAVKEARAFYDAPTG